MQRSYVTPAPGLSFASLYSLCREQLILSNEITLRSHLDEFSDHDLVRVNQDAAAMAEGQTHYVVPLRKADMQKLLTEML